VGKLRLLKRLVNVGPRVIGVGKLRLELESALDLELWIEADGPEYSPRSRGPAVAIEPTKEVALA
jgi:hypothetical protein